RHPHGRAVRGSGRGRHLPRGPAVAQEVRAHGGQADRAGRGVAGQASGRRRHRDRLFVVARTDARAVVGLDEACRRAQAAAAIGVDAVFVEAPESTDDMRAIAEATPGCTRVANMIETGKTPLLTPGELHDLGFDLVVSPLTGLLAATRALARAYEVLRREGTLRDHLELVPTFDDFRSVIDLERHYGLEARYTDAGS